MHVSGWHQEFYYSERSKQEECKGQVVPESRELSKGEITYVS